MPFSPLALLSLPLGTPLSCPRLGTNQGSQLISTSPSNCWPEPPISTDYNSSKNTLTALNFLLLSFCQYSSLESLRILKPFSSGLFLFTRKRPPLHFSPLLFSHLFVNFCFSQAYRNKHWAKTYLPWVRQTGPMWPTFNLGQDERPTRPPHGLVTSELILPSFGNNYRKSPESVYK